MADPFVGEIRIVGFNFAPKGWAFCDGRLLPIAQNVALFSILGTTYGGDGKATFALPDLQGSAAIQPGQGQGLTERFQGEIGGAAQVTLIESEIPAHTHTVTGTTARAYDGPGNNSNPAGRRWAAPQREQLYAAADGAVMAGAARIDASSEGLPHDNMPPYLVMNFIIAMQGVFPPRG